MIDAVKSLATIRAALDSVNPGSTDRQVEGARLTATDELRQVAYAVAAFANGLDDGTGFFNSSSEFGEQLSAGFDDRRRVSTLLGLLRGLEVDQLLMAAEYAVLQLHAAAGPSGYPRVELSEENRNALQRISTTASSTLTEAQMPADPEDEES